MSRGHKILQNFLQKRGAWDNNPFKDDKPKEKQMEPKKTRPADWAQSLAAEATVKIKQPGYNPPEQETIMNKEAEPAVKAAANAGTPKFVDLSVIVKKDKKVAEEATASIKAKNYNPGKPEERKDSPQLNSVKADTNRTIDATGEHSPKRSNSGAAEVIKQNASSKSIRDLMANLGIDIKPAVQEAVNSDVKKEINRLGHQAGKGITAGQNVVDKSGAVHTPMSRARHLARLGMQMAKINPKIGESWDDRTLDQIAEVHPAVMAMAKVGAKKDLKAQADKHTELALAANKAGDDDKVKFHQAQVAKIKAKMQEETNLDEASTVYDPITKKMVARKPIKVQAGGGATRNGVPVDTGASKHKSKLPMSKAAGILAAEETEQIDELSKNTLKSYINKASDSKVNLHNISKHFKNRYAKQSETGDYPPRPRGGLDDYEKAEKYADKAEKRGQNIKKAADKLTKEETDQIDELKAATLQNYADKAHQQALDATYDAAHLNRPGEEQLKANAKKLAAKRSGGVQRAQTKLDRMGEELEDQKPQTFAHNTGDIVICKKTHRDAVVQSVEGDNYTVVYADGSTETGPADWWTNAKPVNEGRVFNGDTRTWNVKSLKPAGHGIVGKKVRSYDFPGMHDSHYIEGHVTDEDPQSYHIRTTKVVRHHKEEPIPAHLTHIRAPKGLHIFGNAQGVYYAPKEVKPAAKKTLSGLRNKR